MPYLSASAVVIHYEEALYQVYAPLPLALPLRLYREMEEEDEELRVREEGELEEGELDDDDDEQCVTAEDAKQTGAADDVVDDVGEVSDDATAAAADVTAGRMLRSADRTSDLLGEQFATYNHERWRRSLVEYGGGIRVKPGQAIKVFQISPYVVGLHTLNNPGYSGHVKQGGGSPDEARLE